ncbi:hypothetical protein N9W84_00900 [bacterium]|nr:hypothetical protein [bacterium]
MSKLSNNAFYKKHILPFKTFLEKEKDNVLNARKQSTNLKLTQEETKLLKKIKNRKDDNFFRIDVLDLESMFNKDNLTPICTKLIDASMGKNILNMSTPKYFKNISQKELKEIISHPVWLSKRTVKRKQNDVIVDPGKKEILLVDQDKKSLFSYYARRLVEYFIEDMEEDFFEPQTDNISNENIYDKRINLFKNHSEGLIAYLFLNKQMFIEPKRFLYSTDNRVSQKAAEFLSIPQAINIIKESPELYKVLARKMDIYGYEPGPISKEELKLIKNIEVPSLSGRKVYQVMANKNKINFLLKLSYKYLELREEYLNYDLWTYKRDCIDAAEKVISFFISKINKKHISKFIFLAALPEFKDIIGGKINVEE